MPEDPTVQIVLIIAVMSIIGLALWLGRGLIFRKEKDGVSFMTKQKPGRKSVSVAEGLQAEKAQLGDVTGVETESGTDAASQDHEIDVLKGAVVKGGKVRNITGLKQSGQSSDKAE